VTCCHCSDRDDIEDLRSEVHTLTADLDNVRDELTDACDERDAARADCATACRERDAAREVRDTLADELSDVRAEIVDQSEVIELLRTGVQLMTGSLPPTAFDVAVWLHAAGDAIGHDNRQATPMPPNWLRAVREALDTPVPYSLGHDDLGDLGCSGGSCGGGCDRCPSEVES
jgi:outer membrane murein-binding lipoprotein Lpp